MIKKYQKWLAVLGAVLMLFGATGMEVKAQTPEEAYAQAIAQNKTQEEAYALAVAAHEAAWAKAQADYAALVAAQQQAEVAQQQALVQQQALAAQQAALAQQQAEVAQQQALAAQQAAFAQAVKNSPLRGKKVSILGDSISTFQGYNPPGFASYYPHSGTNLQDVNQTWWMKTIQRTGMQLLVNGSWSGSAVTGDSGANGSSAGCSSYRLALLSMNGVAPDVILVEMGTNDFIASKELGSWKGVPTIREDHYVTSFTEAYELMLQKMRGMYPAAQIYCMTTLPVGGDVPGINAAGSTLGEYNQRIREIAGAYGIPVIEAGACGIYPGELNKYTSDGVHPNVDGAEKMAAYVTNSLFVWNSK